jgi:putative ABC transport system ATP-binding protein
VSETSPLLEYIDVHKWYGDNEVLRGVSLAVQPRDVVVLIGPSGSGKSTLLRCGNGLEVVDEGDVIFDGRSVPKAGRDITTIRAEIGFVFQQFNLLPRTSALENVELPLLYGGGAPRARRARAHTRLAEVGLADREHHHPSQLSGGQQQRVAIARALVNDPAVILADEPTGNLDTRTSAEIMALLQRLNRSGLTIVLVTHEQDIAGFAGRRLVFRDGRLISDQRGTAADAAAMLASMPEEEVVV